MSRDRAQTLPGIWNLALPRNPNFTGRERELERLRAALTSGLPNTAFQAVSGLGGVGKTQLALEYAYRHAGEYDVVWWLRAEEPGTLAADFAELAHALRLPARHEPDQRLANEAVRRWLAQNGRWLLIFDSAREPNEIAPYLSPAGTGHAIVTSRNASWRGLAMSQPMPQLERDESIALLLKRTGQTDEEAAEELAEALGDLPLALEQAGAYIEEKGATIASYLELFNRRQRDLLRKSSEHHAAPTVATTWDLAFQEVRTRSPVAAELLTIAAFLAPDDIPRDGLRAGAAYLPPGLRAAVDDPLALDDAIAALRRYSLIDAHQEALSVHRLVQAVVREHLDDEGRALWAERAVGLVIQSFPTNIDDRESWRACARWLPHARAATAHAEEARTAAEATVLLLGSAGRYLVLRSWCGEARELYDRALPLAEEVHGAEHPAMAQLLEGLGQALMDLGDFKGALAHAERALYIDEANEAAPAVLARDANNLAGVLCRLGDRLDEARALAERALAIDERDGDQAAVVRDATTLAQVLRQIGDLPSARAHAERALAIDTQRLQPDDPELTKRHNNLGFLLRVMGDLTGAREHLEHALAVGEARYGPDEPAVAAFHSNLAAVLEQLGEYAAARAHHERALEIGILVHGPNHHTVAIRHNNLGILLMAVHDLKGAAEHLERAVAIGRKVLPQGHKRGKMFEANLAAVRRAMETASPRR